MADNTTLNAGSGGDVIASDDIGGVKHQRVKVSLGADGSATDALGGAGAVAAGVQRVTLASDDPAVSLLGTIDADTGNLAGILTSVQTLDDAISGNEMQVDVVSSALPSGAATEAKQPALGTAGTASSDVITVQGVASMTPVQVGDNNSTLSVDDGGGILTVDGTVAATQSGNWTARIADGSGNALTSKAPGSERALSVAIVDGSGNQVTSFGGSGGTSATDDSAFTAASGSGTPMMGFATSDSVDSGDVGVVAMTTARALHVALQNAIPAGTNNIGDVDVLSLPALPAGSNAIGTVTAVGAAAEDAAASGNPVLVGGRYDSSPRTLETGDAGAIALNASGQVLVEIAAGAGSGGTAAADDADFTAGTTSGTPMMGAYQSSPTAVTDGDMGIVGITANREVKVAVTSGGVAGAAIDTATGGTDEGVIAIFTRDDALSTLTPVDGDNVQGRTNARGALWVALDSTDAQNVTVAAALPAGTNNIGDVDILSIAAGDNNIGNVDVVSLPALPTGSNVIGALTANQSVNVAQMNGVATTMGNGASGTGVQRVTIANDSTGVLATVSTVTTVGTVTNITNQGQIADDAAFTAATTRVNMAGFFADETATDSVDEGDGGAARMTLDRKQIVTPYAHAAAGGITAFRSIDVDESEDEVKASAGKLFWIHAMNMTASVLYLKVYNNTAAGTTVGTTTPVFTFPVPTLGDTNGAGFYANFGDYGVAMSTGICVAATTALADADTGAPAANAMVVNAGYI